MSRSNRLEWTITVPKGPIKVKVTKGWVTPEGEVDWQFQKNTAEQALHEFVGAKKNYQLYRGKGTAEHGGKAAFKEALKRSAEVDANRITGEVPGDKVILKGKVRSWFEREEAERAAWRAPGVRSVANRIV